VLPEPVSPEDLARAYWTHYRLKESTDPADQLRAADVEWACEMVDDISSGRTWHDYDAEDEGRDERAAPSIGPLALIELLAARAPDDVDDPLGWLAADAMCTYMLNDPDVARVDEAAERNEVFRLAGRPRPQARTLLGRVSVPDKERPGLFWARLDAETRPHAEAREVRLGVLSEQPSGALPSLAAS
jgi:hypothetical protein